MILTQENIDLAKQELRISLPHIRSSHLTEALAAAFAFKSNAALRVSIAADAMPSIAYGRADRFANRLRDFGYALSDADMLQQAIRSGTLYDRPYMEFKRGDIGSSNACFSISRANNRPMVTVAMAKHYAELQWDCITIEPPDDEHARGDQSRELLRTMYARFQERARGLPGKPCFDGSAFVGSVEKLLPHAARDLAEDFFSMLYEPVYKRSGSRRAA
jgi:hypothetical protein